jgi:hypothetical protein
MAPRQVTLVKEFAGLREQVTEVLLLFAGGQLFLVLRLSNK